MPPTVDMHVHVGVLGLPGSESGFISVAPAAVGAVGSDKTCKWLTAHDLNCRKAGEAEFTQKTKKWGVELLQDRGTSRLLYACESGAVALAPVPPGLVTEKGPKWHHALEPRVRAPEQIDFTNAKKIGMEVFKDETSGDLIYIGENGDIDAIAGSVANDTAVKGKPKNPTWKHSWDLKVRKAGEKEG